MTESDNPDQGTSDLDVVAYWTAGELPELEPVAASLAWIGFREAWCVRSTAVPEKTYCLISFHDNALSTPGLYLTGLRSSERESREHLVMLLTGIGKATYDARQSFPTDSNFPDLDRENLVSALHKFSGPQPRSSPGFRTIYSGIPSLEWRDAPSDLANISAENAYYRSYLTSRAGRDENETAVAACSHRSVLLASLQQLPLVPLASICTKLLGSASSDHTDYSTAELLNLSLDLRLARVVNALSYHDSGNDTARYYWHDQIADDIKHQLTLIVHTLRTRTLSESIEQLLALRARLIAYGELDRESTEVAYRLVQHFPELNATLVQTLGIFGFGEKSIQEQATMAARLGAAAQNMISVCGPSYAPLVAAATATNSLAHHAAVAEERESLSSYVSKAFSILRNFRELEAKYGDKPRGDAQTQWESLYLYVLGSLDSALLSMADCLVAVGEWERAVQLLGELQERDPDDKSLSRLSQIAKAVAARQQPGKP